MKRPFASLFVVLALAGGCLTSCGTFSTDSAPGGISSPTTGLDPYAINQWQDRTVRELAY